MLAALCFAALSSAPADAQTLKNPVWNKNFPDPFVVRDGELFYAYATQASRAGFQLMRSRDLIEWEHLGGVNVPDWSNGQLWAPEVYKWRGKWYMFFSARDKTSGKRDLAVSVADQPTGPFKFLSKLIEGTSENKGSDDNGAIDPTLFVQDGKPYMFYIREAPPRAVKLVELTPTLDRTVGERRVMLRVDRPVEQGILDAPSMVYRDGTYWLFYSSGWFQSNKQDAKYQVWAATSKSLFGPYTKPEKPVLAGKAGETYSPGHQCLIELPNGEWWMGYHAWNAEGEPRYRQNPIGRTFRLDRLIWTDQGPKCLGPTLESQPAPKIR